MGRGQGAEQALATAVRCIRHRRGRVKIMVARSDPPRQAGAIEEGAAAGEVGLHPGFGPAALHQVAQVDEPVRALVLQGLDPGGEHPKGPVQILGTGLIGDQAEAHRGFGRGRQGQEQQEEEQGPECGLKTAQGQQSGDRAGPAPAGGRQNAGRPGGRGDQKV